MHIVTIVQEYTFIHTFSSYMFSSYNNTIVIKSHYKLAIKIKREINSLLFMYKGNLNNQRPLVIYNVIKNICFWEICSYVTHVLHTA